MEKPLKKNQKPLVLAIENFGLTVYFLPVAMLKMRSRESITLIELVTRRGHSCVRFGHHETLATLGREKDTTVDRLLSDIRAIIS